MRIPPVLAGVAAGAALAVGGAAAIDFVTQGAEAQSGDPVTQADVRAANQRSQAAINGYKNLSNRLGKYVNDPGQLIGARSGPIRQDRGVGGGLPTSTLADGAVTEPKLSAAVQAKLNAAQTAGQAGPQGPQGPPGAIPSTFATTVGGFAPPTLDGNITQVVNSDGTITGTDGGGPLTIGDQQRIITNGWVDVRNALGTPGEVSCRPASISGPTTSFLGPLNSVTVAPGATVRVSTSGSRDLDADTYQFAVICQTGDSGLTADAAALTALVADR